MLIPRRTKFRKQHRPHRAGLSKGGNRIAFGDYGIQALEPAYVTNRQIEAAHRIGAPVIELHTGAYCEAGFAAGYLDVAQIRLEREVLL